MKLSEAMREGAALHPQAFSDYIDDWNSPDGPSTCALGAAYEGASGLLPFDDPYEAVDQDEDDPRLLRLLKKLQTAPREPRLSDIEVAVQALCNVHHIRDTVLLPNDKDRVGIFVAIAILNDQLHWTREAIADYIAAQGY